MDEELTYLEEFISNLDFVPTDIRRNSELVRELDREVIDYSKELMDKRNEYIVLIKSTNSNSISNINDNISNISDINKNLLSSIDILQTRIQQRIQHKISIIEAIKVNIIKITSKLDSDLLYFEDELKEKGEFENMKGMERDTEVAVRIGHKNEEDDLILGKVISYHPDVGQYFIADVDDDTKRYHVSESQVYTLNLAEASKKLMKNELIYAVYPDTTSFYPAIVTQISKKNPTTDPIVTVQFQGDEDEILGTIPNRIVPLKYVVRIPNVNQQ